MRISFMTLGCPQWDLPTLCRCGREFGFDAVDFRGLQGDLDVTKLPAFTTGIAATRRMLDDHGLAVSGISSSIKVCDASQREANLEEARRTIPVALALDCPNVRVFGGGEVSEGQRDRAAAIGLECLEAILALPGADRLHWLFETHDHWIRGTDCKRLLDTISNPAFGCLWDMGHTARVGGELPAETYAEIGPCVGYTHIKDAVFDRSHPQAMQDGWRYVAPGTGQLPLAESIALLRRQGYAGYFMFEHEKRWHPELPEPEVAFPQFVRWIRSLTTL